MGAKKSGWTGVICAVVALCASACSSGDDGEGSGGGAGSGIPVLGPPGAGGSAGQSAGAGGVGTSMSGTGGAAGTAPVAGTTGGAGTAGAGGSGGVGAGGVGGVGAGAGGAIGGSGGSGGADCTAEGATDHFSFFVTSLAGLQRLSESEDGFGGDLRFGLEDGLSGADEICRQLAETSYPGAGCKTWRAFLSVTEGPDGNPVHAKDRIGDGPWYDRIGRLVAMNKTALLNPWPVGADAAIMMDLPNEDGVPNHDPEGTGIVDNHNSVTGTNAAGMLFSPDWAYTCHDWTSSVGEDGTPMIGFSWYGGAGAAPGSGWYHSSNITEGGCAPWVNLTNMMDFSDRGIGARGGYGGFYCLANEP